MDAWSCLKIASAFSFGDMHVCHSGPAIGCMVLKFISELSS